MLWSGLPPQRNLFWVHFCTPMWWDWVREGMNRSIMGWFGCGLCGVQKPSSNQQRRLSSHAQILKAKTRWTLVSANLAWNSSQNLIIMPWIGPQLTATEERNDPAEDAYYSLYITCIKYGSFQTPIVCQGCTRSRALSMSWKVCGVQRIHCSS